MKTVTTSTKSKTKSTGAKSTSKSASAKGDSKANGKAAKTTASKGKTSSASSKPKASSSARTAKTAGSSAAKKTQARAEKGIVSTMVEKVSGLFTTANPTAVDLLKADHDKVAKLFEKVKANEDGNNAPIFKKIKAELDVHTHIEETIFYPYLIAKGDKELKKIVQEGIEEHRQAKMFLSELDSLAGTTDKFKAKIKVLMEDVDHHVKEEEGEMFPMVEDQFSSEVLEKLGARMEAEKAAFKQPKSKSTSTSH